MINKDSLRDLLYNLYPSQREAIDVRLAQLPDVVEESYLILNEFRKADSTKVYSPKSYQERVFK